MGSVMHGKIIVTILLLFSSLKSSKAQEDSLSCIYNTTNGIYGCSLKIYNPVGRNTFSDISGIHLQNKTDQDVYKIESLQSNSLNVPSIICEKFQNLTQIYLTATGIQRVDDYSFRSCKKVQFLSLYNNRITEITPNAFIQNTGLLTLYLYSNQLTTLPESVFSNLYNLNTLWLDSNRFQVFPPYIFAKLQNLIELDLRTNQISNLQIEWFWDLPNLLRLFLQNNRIEELPTQVFSPLKNMTAISLQNNKLKVIHSESFPNSLKFKIAYFDQNEIFAIDEKFIDSNGIVTVSGQNNLCINSSITDNSPSREALKASLRQCFENYMNGYGYNNSLETTTYNSGQSLCYNGNLDETLCKIGDEIQDSYKKIEDLRVENQYLKQVTEDLSVQLEQQKYELVHLSNEKTDFQVYLNNTVSAFSDALTELQNQIKQKVTGNCTCALRSVGPFNFY